MEKRELELINKVAEQDAGVLALWNQHNEYKKLIEKMEKKSYLSLTETQELKELKKKKLAGKTKLQASLDKYK